MKNAREVAKVIGLFILRFHESVAVYDAGGKLLRQENIIDYTKTNILEGYVFGDIYESILKELQSAGSSGEFLYPKSCYHVYGGNVE